MMNAQMSFRPFTQNAGNFPSADSPADLPVPYRLPYDCPEERYINPVGMCSAPATSGPIVQRPEFSLALYRSSLNPSSVPLMLPPAGGYLY